MAVRKKSVSAKSNSRKVAKAANAGNAKVVKISAAKERQSRIEVLKEIAHKTDLTKMKVENVFEVLNGLIESHMMPRGSGVFTIPGVGVKIRRVKKKASKARTMNSPLLGGKEVSVAGKPARMIVKLSALKVLKEKVTK